MRYAKIAIALILVTIVLILIGQNTDVVVVRFLAWEVSMSRILLLGGALIAGFLAGFLVAKLPSRKH